MKTPIQRLRFHVGERGLSNLARRTRLLAGRFGVTAHRMECALAAYVSAVRKFDVRPTLFVTAILLRRHPRIFRWLRDQGVELAVHGHFHTDHCRLSLEDQRSQLAQAIDEFRSLGVEPQGFRAPYFRWNRDTVRAVAASGLVYSSNRVAVWPTRFTERAGPEAAATYRKAQELYGALSACDIPVLPDNEGGVLDIPVSIPDDEALIDRLGASPDDATSVWCEILDETYRRGEIFTLSIHHERAPILRTALEAVLERARTLDPPVWIAPLSEVASWSLDLRRSDVEVTAPTAGKYHLRLRGSQGAAALVRGVKVDKPTRSGFNGYQVVSATVFTVESTEVPPFVCVSPDSSPQLTTFLRSQGYIVEHGSANGPHGLNVRWTGGQISPEKKLEIINLIEEAPTPLVRIARWPKGARSALAVTGDVDAMSLVDFAWRLAEP